MPLAVVNAAIAAEPASPISGQQILEILRGNNVTELPRYTLRVDVERPVHTIPGQGRAVYRWTISKGPEGIAVSSLADRLPPPVFQQPPSQGYLPLDYYDGRLYISMPRKSLTLSNDQGCETYETNEGFSIGPDGDAKQLATHLVLRQYTLVKDNVESLNWIPYIWLALGQARAADFKTLLADAPTEKGARSLRIQVQRSFMGQGDGQWLLTVDPNEGYLLRSASLIGTANGLTYLNCTTSGTRRFGSIALATEGVLHGWFPGRHDVNITLVDFSEEPDAKLFNDVRAELNQALANDRVDISDDTDPAKPAWVRRAVRGGSGRE